MTGKVQVRCAMYRTKTGERFSGAELRLDGVPFCKAILGTEEDQTDVLLWARRINLEAMR